MSNSKRREQQIAENIRIGDDITHDDLLPVIMTLPEMEERLVWIDHGGAIADSVTGGVCRKEIAVSKYAASRYKDDKRAKQTLDAWLKSEQRLSVDVLTWVPGAPLICTPPEANASARLGFNLWRGLRPMQAPKNWRKRIKLFLEHISFLIPDKSERERHLKWLAHIVQKPGELPHTYYLMIATVQGIGRNWYGSVLTRALRGYVAAGVQLDQLLDGGFNGRLSQKLLATVDELKEASGDGRYKREMRLKSLITEEHRHINPKFGVESVEKNNCRWLMFSNHFDALPFNNEDRRAIVIRNPDKPKSPSYYKRIYKLLDDQLFIASVRKYLETRSIEGFNAGEPAQMNSAKQQSLEAMMGDMERAVHDFMEDCKKPLTTIKLIRKYVDSCDAFDGNNNHLNRAIKDAGMILAARRIEVSTKKHSIVIVKGWTVQQVKDASYDTLLKATGLDNPHMAYGAST